MPKKRTMSARTSGRMGGNKIFERIGKEGMRELSLKAVAARKARREARKQEGTDLLHRSI